LQEALASRSEECSRLRAELSLAKKKTSKMVTRNAELEAAHGKSQALAEDQRMLQEKLANALAVIRRRDADCQAMRKMASRSQAAMLHYTGVSLSALGEANGRVQEVSGKINDDRVQERTLRDGTARDQLFDAVVDYSLAKVEVEKLQEAKVRMAARGGSDGKSLDNNLRRALAEFEEAEGALSMAALRADGDAVGPAVSQYFSALRSDAIAISITAGVPARLKES
ncbi:hypothetical protein FOZ63_014156, partial [Perkinsus olseni]